jgi:hypothetical protein
MWKVAKTKPIEAILSVLPDFPKNRVVTRRPITLRQVLCATCLCVGHQTKQEQVLLDAATAAFFWGGHHAVLFSVVDGCVCGDGRMPWAVQE